MGYTRVKMLVCHPSQWERCEEVDLLVDTGAMLSVIPRQVLDRLEIKPVGRRRFRTFSGAIERDIGAALFKYRDDSAGTSVIFGDETDTPVLGVTALEALGYQVDPITGELKPVELLLL